MHDIVIRGGTIVDGTGRAAFSGDVAIAGGRIAGVGGKQGPGKREIDAAGLLVTPGWVDVHTHYDGQAMWDPLITPSSWHGVTTVMFGNCGVGFAPVKKEHRGALMDLMEGVEEIPNPVLAAGLTWEWETFPQFMDALERRPHAIDIGAQAAHLPLRVYVMGDRAVNRRRSTTSPRCGGSPSRLCNAARSVSPPRAQIRTRPPTANWCRRATPTPTNWSASARRWARSAWARSA